MTRILCPTCPMCDQPPTMTVSVQAFCGNEDCPAFCWDMTQTNAENRRGMTVIDLDKQRPRDEP